MKQVIEQYASAIIASVIGVTLLVVVGQSIYGNGVGIQQVLSLILYDSIDEKAIVENGVIEEYMQDTSMNLEVKNVYMSVDKDAVLSEYYEATVRGEELGQIFFEDAWNMKWEKINVNISADRSRICFLEPGIYWMEIYALDKNEKKHSWVVKVLVNER